MSTRADWMYDVRVKRMFIDPVSKSRVWKLVNRSVKEVKKEDVFGCKYCGMPLRLYQGAKTEWHVQHKFSADAAACPRNNGTGTAPELKTT
ncbi:MAG TPA: hypothetical protein VKX17_08800 [Planctomycetota bacterium]|nr:hypothetical protein [Planctomycetota bacterium]